jgi:PhnB protein
MSPAVKPIPEGYHAVTPYLVVPDVSKIIEFAKATFGAEVLFQMPSPNGGIAHAELQIHDSRVMVGMPMGANKFTTSTLYVYVPDVDATFKRAVQAGGTSVNEPTNQFYGDRNGSVKDAAGNTWLIGTHVEDVSPEELAKRSASARSQSAAG